MYFWHIEPLKQHLTEHGQTDQQTFPYLLYSATVIAVLTAVMWMLPTNHTIWRHLEASGGIVITALGMQWVYRRNGGDRGSEFLSRFISLAWVLWIRFTSVLLLIGITLTVLYFCLPPSTYAWYNPAITISFLIWYCCLYLRLGHHIHDIAKVRGELP